MLTQRELQNRIFHILPTYRGELQKFEERLIFCGHASNYFLGSAFVRGGMYIYGEDSSEHQSAGDFVPIDYIPCDHHLYVIHNEIPERQEFDKDAPLVSYSGHETCPLCGKSLRVELSERLTTKDLVLVACPILKEGETVVDVLPIFSLALAKNAWALDIPYQRSKRALTRVSKLL